MNGIDINHFQFEFDLTWMSFFQNHKGETYLRFGGREDSGPETHLTKAGLVYAMDTALDLHKSKTNDRFGRNKSGEESKLIPEELPSIQKMLAKRKNKCIHCHDVKNAQLRELRSAGKLKKEMVFTYPSPSNLGIRLDPVIQNRIKSVDEGSAADNAGFKSGDILQSLDDYRVFSYADATRALQTAPKQGKLRVVAVREDKVIETEIDLANQWRTVGDPSWRESTHVVGPNSGFWGVQQNAPQKRNLGLGNDKLAVKVTSIWGQWARQAGIKHGDIVTEIDGKSHDMHIKQLQTYLQMKKNWGDTVGITVLRKQKRVELTMKLPAEPNDD